MMNNNKKKRPNWWPHLELCHRNPDVMERVLNQIKLSKSPAGKSTPMQEVNNQNIGELQQLMNKNIPPFRRTMMSS